MLNYKSHVVLYSFSVMPDGYSNIHAGTAGAAAQPLQVVYLNQPPRPRVTYIVQYGRHDLTAVKWYVLYMLASEYICGSLTFIFAISSLFLVRPLQCKLS